MKSLIFIILWALSGVALAYPLSDLPTSPITNAIVASNTNSSTNITTSAYVQLIASTANSISGFCIGNSSGSIIKLATGAALAEVNRVYIPGGSSGCFPMFIMAATRISLEALDATASSGYFTFTGF